MPAREILQVSQAVDVGPALPEAQAQFWSLFDSDSTNAEIEQEHTAESGESNSTVLDDKKANDLNMSAAIYSNTTDSPSTSTATSQTSTVSTTSTTEEMHKADESIINSMSSLDEIISVDTSMPDSPVLHNISSSSVAPSSTETASTTGVSMSTVSSNVTRPSTRYPDVTSSPAINIAGNMPGSSAIVASGSVFTLFVVVLAITFC